MIKQIPPHCGDEACSSCVVAGEHIFLAHHGGGPAIKEVKHPMRETFASMKQTFASANATPDDIVQLPFHLKDTADFDAARAVFFAYFPDGFSAKMTVTTDFIDDACRCQMTGIAKPPAKECP
ncbi:MAG: RidA family protein [Clostridia bacterium]